jgi:hypothetical protein
VSSLIIGAWAELIAVARVLAARLPTGAWPGWLFMITMTGWFTFCDSWAASAGVIDPSNALTSSVAALAVALAAALAAAD